MGANVAEAEDAAQRAMEDVFHRWNLISSPAAYAHRAAINYFIKERSRSRNGLNRIMALAPPAESDYSAERALTRWEDREWVESILSALTPAQREVVALVTDGWGLPEITEHLGKTPDTVRQNLYKARQRLKEFVGPAGEDAGLVPKGRSPGRPPSCSRAVALHILALRRAGLSYAQISTTLNAEGLPTPAGHSAWSKSHVDRLLHTKFVQDLLSEEEG